MKVALVTTSPGIRSGIGDYTRHLLPYLRGYADVDLYVEPGGEQTGADGEVCRSVEELRIRDYDQLLYQVGNERNHAFMAPMLRAVGGTAMLHDWVLFDMAVAAHPSLARGGWKGHAAALRVGGVGQARIYSANWMARRRGRTRPAPDVDPEGVPGILIAGWHGLEPNGRWTADRALARIPARGVSEVRVMLAAAPAHRITLYGASTGRRPDSPVFDATIEGCEETLRLGLEKADEPVFVLHNEGIAVTDEQRAHGDVRRLGSFVERVEWTDAEGDHELDLSLAPRVPVRPTDLSRDRFRLPFNRPVVRHADSFIVHSEYVKRLVLEDRNQLTPIAVVHHGAEQRWREGDRRESRARLGFPADWRDAFIVVSFGGVQSHKRIDQLLASVARARRTRPDVRLVLAGGYDPEDLDPLQLARALGVEDSVHVTGYLPEETAWDVIHAGNVCVNLRGPTSGGTSGGVFQSLGLGRGVIATGEAEQRDLPEDCVLKVPLGEGEVEAITALLTQLAGDPARVERIETAARAFVESECHWRHTAKRYAEALELFPPPRVNRKSLIAMRVALAREPRGAK